MAGSFHTFAASVRTNACQALRLVRFACNDKGRLGIRNSRFNTSLVSSALGLSLCRGLPSPTIVPHDLGDAYVQSLGRACDTKVERREKLKESPRSLRTRTSGRSVSHAGRG